jgi:hypothetical protein
VVYVSIDPYHPFLSEEGDLDDSGSRAGSWLAKRWGQPNASTLEPRPYGKEGNAMKGLVVLLTLMLLITYAVSSRGSEDDDTTEVETHAVSGTPAEPAHQIPIAPGVWYPGEPLPERPIRYYRVRCWPGCHRGSSYGKYPNEPLNMKPIFPTRSIDLAPARPSDTE